MRIEEFLNLFWINIFPAADDHVLNTAGDLVIPLIVNHCQIARMKPSILVDRLTRGLLHLIVTAHDVIAARAEFTCGIRRQSLASFRVDVLCFDIRHGTPNCRNAQIETVVRRRHCTGGRSFRLPICNRDFPHPHLIHDKLHHLNRARRTRHNACTQPREFIIVKGWVLQHSDKHRRHAVHRRALLILERLHNLGRAVCFDRHH